MALGGSIKGFASFIRPVVAVDGMMLKHKYSGYLYITSVVDGNGQTCLASMPMQPSKTVEESHRCVQIFLPSNSD